MAIKTGTLGALLQGVSQQPDRIRLDGKVTEQINLMSDVASGLITRPGSQLIGEFVNPVGTTFYPVEVENRQFIILTGEGTVRAWEVVNNQLVARTITNEVSQAYFGPDMRFHVVEGRLVCVNRNRVVQTVPNNTPRNRYFGVIQVRQGVYSRTYRARIQFLGVTPATSINVAYTTPDGTGSGDGVNSSTTKIAEELMNAIMAHPNKPANLEMNRQAHDMIAIYSPTDEFRIQTNDGQGNEALRSVTDEVSQLSDLPKYAPPNMVVRVRASAATTDQYWMRFDARTPPSSNPLGSSWSEGTWVEHKDPYAVEEFNLATMPHVLEVGATDLTLKRPEWLPRQVGDADSAPLPSIVGKPIRDISGFESRLVLLTPDSVVMSRTNHPFDLWRESATLISASDPIDMTSTLKAGLRFDWLVPFDRDLFVIADPGAGQLVIRGGGVTPEDASMVLTTEYEVRSAGCSPVSTGRTVFLPYTTGIYSGINEFYTNSENSAQAANSLTETLSRYIVGIIRRMAVSPTFNLGLIATTENLDTLWAYKYLWDGSELIQSAWSKWKFHGDVLQFFFDASTLYVIRRNNNRTFLDALDLNLPEGPYGYPIALDSYSTSVSSPHNGDEELSCISTDYGNISRYVQHTGCANPGMEVVPEFVTPMGNGFMACFDADIIPVGASVIHGVPVEWSLTPTEVYGRDYQGRVDSSQSVVILEYTVRVEKSGPIKAEFTSNYGPTYTFGEELYPLDNEPAYPNPPYLISEDIVIPWGERADWSKLRLWGNDYRPVNIIEVQWSAQITSPRGRRS